MFYLEDTTLYNSDWHLNHKKIWIYEFDKRSKYINKDLYPEIKTVSDLEDFYWKHSWIKESDTMTNEELENYNQHNKSIIRDFILDTEYNMLLDIYNSLLIFIENNDITSYVNIWDFLFNPAWKQMRDYMETENFALVKKIFNVFNENLIHTELYLWNHDEYNKFPEFYDDLFESVSIVSFHYWTVIAHYPFSKESQFFQMKDMTSKRTVVKKSIHGHTHSSKPNEMFEKENKNIEYINVCVEQFM